MITEVLVFLAFVLSPLSLLLVFTIIWSVPHGQPVAIDIVRKESLFSIVLTGPLTIRKYEDNKVEEEEDLWANWNKNAEWDNQDEQPVLNE